MSWRLATLVLYIVACVGSVVFPIYYHRTARWWKSTVGKLIMADALVVSLLLNQALLRYFVHDLPGKTLLPRILIFLLAVVTWWRIWVYHREQVKARKRGDVNERKKDERDKKPA